LVGRLLKPGEQGTSYSDEDDDPMGSSSDKSGTDQDRIGEKEVKEELQPKE